MADEAKRVPEAGLGPEDLSTRGLPTARRGYEKKAVDALVASAVMRWSELYDRYAELLAEVAQLGGVDHLARDLGAIGEEVGRILEAANEAAIGLRARAAEDAERLDEESTKKAADTIADAESQAAELRGAAWEEGTSLVESAAAAARSILDDAGQEVLRLRAEGEREAHRRLATTRKESDRIVREARRDAAHQLALARQLAREIIERAEAGSVEGAGTAEKTKILAEIDKIRAVQSIEDVSVLPADVASRRRGAARRRRAGSDMSDALAADVESLRDTAATAGSADGEAWGAGAAAPSGGPAPEIRSLFDELRTTEGPDGGAPADPISDRDRRLLLVHNAAVREVKRRISELQEQVVGDGGDPGPPPSAEAMGSDLGAALAPLVTRALTAGARAAHESTGAVGKPEAGPRVERLIADMAEDLAGRIHPALEDATEAGAVSSTLRRVFRRWRNDEAERWVRTILVAAFNDAMLTSLAGEGFDRVRGVPSGSPCRDCLGASSSVWDPADPPADLGVPPVDIDCRCGIEVISEERVAAGE